jgi:hypothetical protein
MGPDVETLIVPNYINGAKVNSIKCTSAAGGITNGKNIQNVIISRGINIIDDYAFYDGTSIKTISIPDTVTKIGWSSFFFCSELTTITIPNSVLSISDGAFSYCTGLTQIILDMEENLIPSDMYKWDAENATIVWTGGPHVNFEDLSNWKFDTSTGIVTKYIGKTNVANLIVPAYIGGIKVNEIRGEGSNGLTRERNVKTVVVSDGIITVGPRAFYICNNLTNITLPNSITSIGYDAFDDCDNLTNITIPDNVTSIGTQAFGSCNNLTSVTLSKNLTSIGMYAFGYSIKLASITIPSNVTAIDSTAFSGCTNLTQIAVNRANDGSLTGAPWGATSANVTWNP